MNAGPSRHELQEWTAGDASLLDALPDAVFVLAPESGVVLDANPHAAWLLGRPRAALQGATFASLVRGDLDVRWLDAPAKKLRLPELVRADGSTFWPEASTGRFSWEGRAAVLVVVHDVTAELEYQAVFELSQAVQRAVRQPGTHAEAQQRALEVIQKQLGFDGVALRLRDGGDFPYTAAAGLPETFVRRERSLLVRDRTGEPCLNERGEPQLACHCGAVINGKVDPAKACFTEGGSYWTNDSAREPVAPFHRGTCAHFGYASVALVPLKLQGDTVGLLQLNDRRPNRLSKAKVRALEELGAALAEALAHKQYEDALRAQAEENRALIAAIPDMVFVNRRDGTFLACHAPDPGSLLVPPSLFLQRKLHEILPADVAHRFLEAYAAALDHGGVQHVTYDLPIGPEVRHFEARVVRCGDDQLFTLARDITDRRDAEEAMRAAARAAQAANELKSRFLANMSHEIRTPLNAVIGLSRLCLDEPDAERVREYVRIINESGRGLLGLVNDVLDFSKIEAGRMQVEAAPFDLHALLRSVHETARLTAQQKRLEVNLRLSPAVPRVVVADPLRIRQVLNNLLSNAVKFTEAGSVELFADTGLRPGELVLSVSDTGLGMTEAQVANLFQPFMQADASTTRRFGGTGLGLAISRELARSMGGELGVDSALGQGSVFLFRVRFGEPTEVQRAHVMASDAAPVAAPTELAGGRVLLVEDNRVNQLLARRVLEKAGLQVTLAENGRQAVELATAPGKHFEVVLMDVQMPEMDGLEATRRLKAQLGAACPPIVAMTAHTMSEERDRCLDAGMVAHLPKPIDVQQLYGLLARLLPQVPQRA